MESTRNAVSFFVSFSEITDAIDATYAALNFKLKIGHIMINVQTFSIMQSLIFV